MFVKPTQGTLRPIPQQSFLATASRAKAIPLPAAGRDSVTLKFGARWGKSGEPTLQDQVHQIEPLLQGLLKSPAALNEPLPNGSYPLAQAATFGMDPMVIAMLRMGAQVNPPETNFLRDAMSNDQEKTAVILVNHRIRLQDDHFNAIHETILACMPDLANAIIKRLELDKTSKAKESNLDLFSKDVMDRTAIHLGANYFDRISGENQQKVIQIIKAIFKADPGRMFSLDHKPVKAIDLQDKTGKTALHHLMETFNGSDNALELARYFLKDLDANPALRDSFGRMPLEVLFIAASFNRTEENAPQFSAMATLLTDKLMPFKGNWPSGFVATVADELK